MRYLLKAFLILLIICQLGCKKKADTVSPTSEQKTYETIKPQSYFPAYPGSYWKYRVNDSLELTDSISPHYVKYAYQTELYPATYTDSVYVPFCNNQPVFGYNHLVMQPLVWCYKQIPFLSETVGDAFQNAIPDPRQNHSWEDNIYVIDKTKKGNDSVITTKRELIFIMPIPIITLYYTEYTKDIGITKYCIINGTTLDTTYKKVLISYHINK
jgi:hypothetical protein